jgi:peptidylprolyl isomerase
MILRRNYFISLAGAAVLLACGFACAQESKETLKTSNQTETKMAPEQDSEEAQAAPISQDDVLKASEAFGHFIGRNLKAPGINFDLDSIIKGMRDGFAGKPAPLSDKEYEELMAKIQEEAYNKMAMQNLKTANEFLEKNSSAEGVMVIEPGKLQYIILSEGSSPAVEEHASPQIKYTGKFADGTTFGSSEETGGPITIPLDQTIPGFSKGIVGMKEGEKRKLFVHPDLGYGTTGHLPPNSLLIFEVEVVKANAPEADSDALSLNDSDEEDENYEEDHADDHNDDDHE